MFQSLVEEVRYIVLSEAATDMQRSQGLKKRMTRSGRSISMGAPTHREKQARRKAEKHGQSPSHAHMKADLRQTLGPDTGDELGGHPGGLKNISKLVHARSKGKHGRRTMLSPGKSKLPR